MLYRVLFTDSVEVKPRRPPDSKSRSGHNAKLSCIVRRSMGIVCGRTMPWRVRALERLEEQVTVEAERDDPAQHCDGPQHQPKWPLGQP